MHKKMSHYVRTLTAYYYLYENQNIYIYIHIYIYIIIIPSLLLFEDRYIMIYIIVHIDRSILLLSIHNILHKCRKKQPSVRFGR